jgi:hypothetical protein
MAAGLRFAGQDASITLANLTTGAQVVPDIPIEKSTITFNMVVNKKEFLGEIGPDYREFTDGVTIDLSVEPNDAGQIVDLVSQIQAKAQGASTDQFAYSAQFTSPDGGVFRVVVPDIHWDTFALEMAGRTELASTTLKAMAKTFKIQKV